MVGPALDPVDDPAAEPSRGGGSGQSGIGFGYISERLPDFRLAYGTPRWMLAVFVAVTASSLVLGGWAWLELHVFRCPPNRSTARMDMRTILPVAEKYRVDHPGSCPTVATLVRERELSAASVVADPWGTAFVIGCDDGSGDVSLTSAGPDRRFGTVDDLHFPDV